MKRLLGIKMQSTELIKEKKSPYGLFHIFSLIEFEILKTYIKIYLKTEFIYLFKSSTDTFILFNKLLNSSLYLCIDN